MNEKLLHFIWRFRLFDLSKLLTTKGEKIEIIHQGIYNTNAGADFQNAKIKIGNTLWAGNVELHVNSDDWFLHKHQNDFAYNNIILHVVYEATNKTAERKGGEEIPTLVLKDLINPQTLFRFQELSLRKKWIPCEKFFSSVDEFTVQSFLERLSIERMESKVEQIQNCLHESENDWENVMFQTIASYLGANINKVPFLLLAKSLPVKIWAKHQSDPLQIEALLFGQSGFLEEEFTDEYPKQLRKEFQYLKRLYNLKPLQKHIWKFLRLRPSNFPTIRLAQLAAIMSKEVKLFSEIIEAESANTICGLFDAEVTSYWKQHYVFDKFSKRVNSHLGTSAKNILLINAICPVLFAYGRYKDNEADCNKALKLLLESKAEKNTIISGWKNLGLISQNASQSQALLQLKNEYCNYFRCTDCAIGAKILQ